MVTMVKLKPSNQSLSARGLPVNPPVVKKRITRKKKVTNPVKNVNDDDSDKRQSCENGLDRCASLLAAMLEPPCGNIPKPTKKKVYNKRSSTPIDNIGNKAMKLPTAVSCTIDCTQVSDTNTIDELIEEKELLQRYLNKIVHRSSEIEKQVKAVTKDDLSDIDQNADVTRDNEKSLGNRQQQQQSKDDHANISEHSLSSVHSNNNNNNNNNDNRDDDVTITVDNDNDNTLTNDNSNKDQNSKNNTYDINNGRNDIEKNESDKSELFEILESITSKLRLRGDHYNTDSDGGGMRNMNNENHNDGSNSIHEMPHCNDIKITEDNSRKINGVDQCKNDNITNDEIHSFSRDKTLTNVIDASKGVSNVRMDDLCNQSAFENSRDTENIDDPRDLIFKTYRDNLPSFLQVTLGKSIEESHNSNNSRCDAALLSGNHQAMSSGNHQAMSSVNHQAMSSGNHQALSSGNQQAMSSGNQQAMSSGNHQAMSSGNHQAMSSGNHQAMSSGNPLITNNIRLGQKQKPTSLEIPSSSNTYLHENLGSLNIGNTHLDKNPGSSNIGVYSDHTNIQLATLEYLIKELRTKMMKQWNIEVDQLFTEIEHVIGSLSFLFDTISHDTQTDVNNVLHPLHVENADLRRKSQFLSEKVEDLNETINQLKENDSRNVKNEEASVDLIIKTVQEKLGSEQRLKNEMNTELVDLRKIIVELKKENSSLVQTVTEKDMKELEEREKYLKEKSSKEQEIALLHVRIEELQVHKQADEKERNIMNLSLRQRDYEIDRLSKLNSDLQESVSKLLADISDAKKKQDRQPKYNSAMSTRYVPPTRNEPKSPPEQYPVEVSSGYNMNVSNNRVLSTHQPSLPDNIISPSSGICSSQKYHGNDESDNLSTIVNNISENSATALSLKSRMSTLSETDFSLWSLATYDGAEFQRNIEHLDAEIKRIQTSIKRSNNM